MWKLAEEKTETRFAFGSQVYYDAGSGAAVSSRFHTSGRN